MNDPLDTISSVIQTALFPSHESTHVFDGNPDSRQSDSHHLKTSRFRPRYRALNDEEKSLHDQIKAQAVILESLFEQVPAGRYQALGMTALEESVMWAIKALTA